MKNVKVCMSKMQTCFLKGDNITLFLLLAIFHIKRFRTRGLKIMPMIKWVIISRQTLYGIFWLLLPMHSAFAQDSAKALRQAVIANDSISVIRLVKDTSIVNSKNVEGLSPLMIASALGNEGICKLLIDAGANVSAKTEIKGRTALMFAADFGNLSIVQLLVKSGAAIIQKDDNGYAAIDFSIVPNKNDTKEDEEKALAVGKWLKSKGAEIKSSLQDIVGLILALSDTDLSKLIENARQEK